MAINKVIYGDQPLIDLTEDTITADSMLSGVTAHGANGEQIYGTMSQVTPATETPLMDGTAAVGTSIKYAREDHIHPHDSSIPTKVSDLTNDSGFIAAPSANVDEVIAYNGTTWVADKRMVILSYGSSTWTDFINAYNSNAVIYCRASSNSNPATGNQGRMAFMAYVNYSGSTVTNVEFQYYRSVSTHSASQQGDQVFIYKLENTNGGKWTVTTREASSKIVAGTGLSSSYSNGILTLTNSETGLPDVTTTDNEKVLRVVNGVWTTAYPANEAVAPEYDATSTYEIGDYCIYNGMLYKCTTAIATGGETWNAAHWAQVSVSEELGNGGAVESVNGKTGVVVLDANDVSAVSTSDFDSFRGAFKAFTVTLASGSWSSKAQTVSNANFLATGYAYLVYPQGSHMAIYSEDIVYADNVTTDGQMTFHCTTVPTSNLTVNIVRMYAS